MFKRKLQALNFHSPDCDFKDETEFRNLVCWLEDRKINHYKPEDRTELRDICSGDWEQIFSKYLMDINCPICTYDKSERNKIVDWLLSLAVHLEYGGKAQKMKSIYGYGGLASSNPLEKMDYTSDEFKTGIASISKLLQIPPHPDPLVTLKAVSLLVKEKLSKEALDRFHKKGIAHALIISLDEVELGFQTKDLITQEAGKILRLLFLKELRELQDIANEAIVNAQALTANPKTDTKLGKVGI